MKIREIKEEGDSSVNRKLTECLKRRGLLLDDDNPDRVAIGKRIRALKQIDREEAR